MGSCEKTEFYLNNGRLDLSSLDEEIYKDKKIGNEPQIKDSELVELQTNNISVSLGEMASMFDDSSAENEKKPKDFKESIGDEFEKAFNPERLNAEMKEFGIDK